jgi:hypothetical protein
MKEPKAYREKEEIEPGAVLASVERDVAWIARGAEREKLEIVPVGSRGPNAGASPVASRGGSASGAAVSGNRPAYVDDGEGISRSTQLRRSRRKPR